jgi:hypothetical protein
MLAALDLALLAIFVFQFLRPAKKRDGKLLS